MVTVVGHSIQTTAQCQTIRDAVTAHTDVISGYLANSETVLAVLLSPHGTILESNCAAKRMFSDSGNGTAELKIWNHLPGSELEDLQQRLSETGDGSDALFLLNLVHGEQGPTTWEARLLRCNGAFLLLATEEHYHDALFQSETLRLTNDLSIAVREATQKNRELKQANQTIEMLARTDSLTGLANRRMLEECLPKEVARANRLNENLSMIFIDIDHFKPINDQFGHNCGDRILVELGAILKSQIRSYALAARFGGDEFVLLLPGTGNAGAILITERIAEKVRNLCVPGNRIPVTVSMGIATFATGESGTELMSRADEALYRAKDKGRNRFEVA